MHGIVVNAFALVTAPSLSQGVANLPAPIAVAVNSPVGIGRAVDEYFTRASAHGFCGTVIVAHGKDILLKKAYGDADWKTGTAATTRTAYDIASLDKQFIASAILKLEEMGKLKTTESIGRFFDSVPDNRKAITLEHLLHHTSGLPDEYWDEHPEMTREQFIRFVLRGERKLAASPGERFLYAAANYWILEGIIERASGMGYEEFLLRHLFQPANMRNTGTVLPKWEPDQVARLRFWTTGNWPLGAIDYGNILSRPFPYRTLLSTVEDLHRWYLALRDRKVLTAQSIEKLFTPGMAHYARGWNVVPTSRGTTLIHHGGGGTGGGMRATFRYFPEEDVFFAVLSGVLDLSIQSDYLGSDVERLIFGGMMAMPPAQRGPMTANKISGKYRLASGATFQVLERSGNRILLTTDDARAILPLRFPDLESAPGALPQDDQAIAIIRAMSAGDYEPLRQTLQRGVSFERYKAQLEQKWKQAASLGQLRDLRTLWQSLRDIDGQQELQSYIALRFERGEMLLRVLRNAAGRVFIDSPRLPNRFEAILAPIVDSTYSAWDFKLGTGTRFVFNTTAAQGTIVKLCGRVATIEAVRIAEES
jgi:CubicO group peptidase (beta-lactamase class C family)